MICQCHDTWLQLLKEAHIRLLASVKWNVHHIAKYLTIGKKLKINNYSGCKFWIFTSPWLSCVEIEFPIIGNGFWPFFPNPCHNTLCFISILYIVKQDSFLCKSFLSLWIYAKNMLFGCNNFNMDGIFSSCDIDLSSQLIGHTNRHFHHLG